VNRNENSRIFYVIVGLCLALLLGVVTYVFAGDEPDAPKTKMTVGLPLHSLPGQTHNN
jgi:hypothetical protein